MPVSLVGHQQESDRRRASKPVCPAKGLGAFTIQRKESTACAGKLCFHNYLRAPIFDTERHMRHHDRAAAMQPASPQPLPTSALEGRMMTDSVHSTAMPDAEPIESDRLAEHSARAVKRALGLPPDASIADAMTALAVEEPVLADLCGTHYFFDHHGDAMMPAWRHGDCAIIDDTNRTPSQAGDFLIVEDGAEVIRRLEALPDGTLTIRASTLNPRAHYERPLGELRIIGRVVGRATSYMPPAPKGGL
jgi:phage repressor protein C with HTH and peptisase S24 domain